MTRIKPRIVASLGIGAEGDASKAAEEGADIIEVRLDLAEGDPIDVIASARRASDLPIIATARMREEGGRFGGTEEERMDLLIEASPYADFMDIELRAEGRRWLTGKLDLPAIISYHDFRGMPTHESLRSILSEMSEAGAFISKIAATPSSLKDCLRLLDLLADAVPPICVIGMGEIGRHLRAVAPVYGSALTYGYVSEPTAPGQMSVQELKAALDLLIVNRR